MLDLNDFFPLILHRQFIGCFQRRFASFRSTNCQLFPHRRAQFINPLIIRRAISDIKLNIIFEKLNEAAAKVDALRLILGVYQVNIRKIKKNKKRFLTRTAFYASKNYKCFRVSVTQPEYKHEFMVSD